MKIITSIVIDPEVWKAAQKKYPRQLSHMIEEYLRIIINQESTLNTNNSEMIPEQTIEEKNEFEQRPLQEPSIKVRKFTEEERLEKLKKWGILPPPEVTKNAKPSAQEATTEHEHNN